jgi:hypothetical protein
MHAGRQEYVLTMEEMEGWGMGEGREKTLQLRQMD